MAKKRFFGISNELNQGITDTLDIVRNHFGELHFEIIPLGKIEPDPHNPRELSISVQDVKKGLNPKDPIWLTKNEELNALLQLAETIKKVGVRNPIEVYKEGTVYRIIAGERRFLASILAGKHDIYARISESKPSEFDIRFLQLVENFHRSDLNSWERIKNVRMLINAYEKKNNTPIQAEILKTLIGCETSQAHTYLSCINAQNDVMEFLEKQPSCSLEKIAMVTKIKSLELRKQVLIKCQEGVSLKDIRHLIASFTQKSLPILSNSIKRSGRKYTRVVLGVTKKISAVRKIVELIIQQDEYKKFHDFFASVDWNDYEKASQAFSKLLKIMEKTEK